MFPNTHFWPWRFRAVPMYFWDNESNQRAYLDYLFRLLNFKFDDQGEIVLTELYGLRQKHFLENHGNGLLSKFNGSVSKLVQSLYPNYPWLRWRFVNLS